MITAHLSPGAHAYTDSTYVLRANNPGEPEELISYFFALSEDEALCFAGTLLQRRWPDKNIDIDLHVHSTKGPA